MTPTAQAPVFLAPQQKNSLERNSTRQEKRQKFRLLVEDAARRTITKECNAVRRIAKNNLPHDPNTFKENVADFWQDHTEHVQSSFRPAITTYRANKADTIIHNIVEDLKGESLRCTTRAARKDDPLAAVTLLLDQWTASRHTDIAERFCSGQYD